MTIRIQSRRYAKRSDGDSEISISGLSEKEVKLLEGAIAGHYWVQFHKDHIQAHPVRGPLPDPIEDEAMLPFWRRHEEGNQITQHKEMFTDHEAAAKLHFPSFYIQHLCGYNYSPSNYKKQAQSLESYGFVCLRSQRGIDGKFWEMWYLPGTFAVKGDLEVYIKKREGEIRKEEASDGKRGQVLTKEIVQFLCEKVQFGTLDVVIQRAAMAMDD